MSRARGVAEAWMDRAKAPANQRFPESLRYSELVSGGYHFRIRIIAWSHSYCEYYPRILLDINICFPPN
jgi:hypothetical protein